MELKKVYCKHFPFKGYMALTLYSWLFIREDCWKKVSKRVERHESTHALQQLECLWLFFLIIYGFEYLIKLFITFSHSRAYRSISFEQEAYEHETEVYYNDVRKHYAWMKYIFKLNNKKK